MATVVQQPRRFSSQYHGNDMYRPTRLHRGLDVLRGEDHLSINEERGYGLYGWRQTAYRIAGSTGKTLLHAHDAMIPASDLEECVLRYTVMDVYGSAVLLAEFLWDQDCTLRIFLPDKSVYECGNYKRSYLGTSFQLFDNHFTPVFTARGPSWGCTFVYDIYSSGRRERLGAIIFSRSDCTSCLYGLTTCSLNFRTNLDISNKALFLAMVFYLKAMDAKMNSSFSGI